MKKALVILLALSLILSLAACGGGGTTAAGGSTEAAKSEAEPAAAESTAGEAVQEAAEPAAASTVSAATAVSAASAETAATATTAASTEAAAESATEAAETAMSADTSRPAAAETSAPAAAVGAYKLTAHAGELGENLKAVSTIVELGAKFYIFLNEDGTGSMNFLEAEIPVEWDDSSVIIQSENKELFPDPIRISYTCDGDFLKLSTQEYSLDFERLNDEELAYYKENGAGGLGKQLSKIAEKVTGVVDGDMIEGLIGDLAFGLLMGNGGAWKPEAIPEGETSEGPVTAVVRGMEITVLGAEHVQKYDKDLIVFYFDVTNTSNEIQAGWDLEYGATQSGEFLEAFWEEEVVPEVYNSNLNIAPGRTLRIADVYEFDPNGGVVAFRINEDDDYENAAVYYADPQNLSGAPEPFVYDQDPSIPAFLDSLPAENEKFRVESAEFFKDDDGNTNVRFFFYFKNTSGEDESFRMNHSCFAVQDGIGVEPNFINESVEEENNCLVDVKPGEEIRCARSFKLHTGSPVGFVLSKDNGDYVTFTDEVAWTTEVTEP